MLTVLRFFFHGSTSYSEVQYDLHRSWSLYLQYAGFCFWNSSEECFRDLCIPDYSKIWQRNLRKFPKQNFVFCQDFILLFTKSLLFFTPQVNFCEKKNSLHPKIINCLICKMSQYFICGEIVKKFCHFFSRNILKTNLWPHYSSP